MSGDMDDKGRNQEWSDLAADGLIVVPEQAPVAVYSAGCGDIFIKQRARGEPYDRVIRLTPRNAVAVAYRIISHVHSRPVFDPDEEEDAAWSPLGIASDPPVNET